MRDCQADHSPLSRPLMTASEHTRLLESVQVHGHRQNYGLKPHKTLGPLELPRNTRYGILIGVWIANFLSALNTTMVATLLSSISSDFQKSHQASWLGTAYLLATCTFTPLYGRLCNAMGRRAANQTAVTFAAVGTAVCGLSNSMEMLIAARFVAGMGGGGVFTTASIITCDMYSMRSRGLTQGVAAIFESLGMGLGGPFGGFINDRFGWRWAFLSQLPLFALSLALTSWYLHYPTPGRSASAKEILKKIDYSGSFALFGAVLSFLVFLTARYSNEQPWSSPLVYMTFATSIVLAVAFFVVEIKYASEPILPPSLVKMKVPMLVGTASFMVSMCNFAIMYNLPTWFQTVMLTSAGEAGAHLIPNGVSLSFGSLFAGWIMHRTGRYRTVTLVCGILPFISAVMISRMTEKSHPLVLWLGIFPLGFGNAVVLQTMLIALLSHIPASALAIGTGFSQFWRGVGQVSGVGLSSAIFQSSLNTELHKRISGQGSEELISRIRHSATLVAELPPDLQRAARDAYAGSIQNVFIAAACSTFIAYLIRFPVPDRELEDEPEQDAKSVGSSSASPSLPRTPLPDSGETSAVEDIDWESEDDTLFVKHSRRLSTYEAGCSAALASPVDLDDPQANTADPMAELLRDDEEC